MVDDWLDLSTGINPYPWPGVTSIRIDWRHLPAPEALTALEEAAAAHFGTSAAPVCAVPGSEIGLRLLGALMPGQAVHVTPCYSTHAEALPGSVAIDVEALDEAAQAGRTVLLANPNNPDGRRIAPERLLDLARTTQRHGGWVIVDEAFADCDEDTSIASRVGGELPLIVLRSLGKFFGLAGVRLGFIVAPDAIVAALRERLGNWPVSAAAIAIGTAAYRDTEWIEQMRTRLAAEAGALDAMLARHGLAAVGHCPLFRLVEAPGAAALFEGLARQHILTRPFDYRPDWLRIGLPGNAQALARLDAALRHG